MRGYRFIVEFTMKFLFGLISLLIVTSASANVTFNTAHQEENTHAAQQAPYVLLISIDGFRWDYVEKYQPKFLSNWVKDSARLEALRPSFPTKTFPNHLSIVTGSYPQRHGIMANRFYAPDLDKHYALSDPKAVLNPDFYLVKPLWVLAEEQGMRTSAYFWPGSEAAIAGKTPTFFQNYDHHQPHQDRINTVIKWYNLPEARRPHLTTMYFHDVDSAGHEYGQDSQELRQAIANVDDSLRDLITKLAKLPIEVNVVIVSDHGMAQRNREDFEKLPSWVNEEYYVKGTGPITHIYDTKGSKRTLAETTALLNKQAKHFKCYRYQDIPARYNSSQSNRIGDIACLADKDWAIGMVSHRPLGDHGWSQFNSTDMNGIFYAKGPAFEKNVVQPISENINIMPLLARILNIKITHEIDGSADALAPLLK